MGPFLLFQCIFYWCVLAFIEADMFTGVRVSIMTVFVRVKSMVCTFAYSHGSIDTHSADCAAVRCRAG